MSRYQDADGKLVRVPGYSDQAKSWELARKPECGVDGDWIKHQRTAMSDHLSAYRGHLEARNASDEYVGQTHERIQRTIDSCGFKLLRQIKSTVLEDWLARQRKDGTFGSWTPVAPRPIPLSRSRR